MIRILLVEDQSMVRQGLKMIIEQDEEFSVIGEAENGREAIAFLENHAVDVVLMDVRMPVMNGLEAAHKIKQRWPEIKIIILTTFNDEEYALQAFKDGVSGFLLKTADGPKLIHSIRSSINGGISIHEQVAAKVMPKLLQKPAAPPANLPLTPRELEITKMVGQGKTNKEISAELYLSIGTVKNHLTQILDKLELRDRTQLAIFAVKNNII
ncbi:response regulator transcription factor [Bacillus methanolicus]|uniref:Two component transcriptional regulator, LuxR family protein n=1 Tax=Bacillus methanolicus (strain MGA3 / ATCC 53907) TaxID=796606 RepID=I3E7K6_BACMM|nr:response regulator transcription factor [Bacillus methanolicus]AIE59302.1 two component transcriptional regulator, LuxR family protein [Bacillus methanolicus MGA3]EIJ82477.1 two-component response regulator [Bacillus methanolicus MGA3]